MILRDPGEIVQDIMVFLDNIFGNQCGFVGFLFKIKVWYRVI